ncbi:MAG: geranylgeranyl reductase family protein [Aquificaceae bacterium]|nr:geranylgeranyl reductase family protein [Aquificaceae bacterium]
MKFNAIVVSAGPAGSSTAYHLAKSGLKVLLLEKETMPRFKLCAGCLSARAVKFLPEGYQHLFLNKIRSGRLGFRGVEEVRVKTEGEVAYIVDRSTFDHFLAQKAQEAGAEFLNGEFLGFDKEGAGYRVFTSRGSFLTEFVVGADGVRSRVSKLLGFRKKYYRSVEFFTHGRMEDEVLIEIGLVRRGYLWVFPHGEGISVGVASAGKEDLISILKDYCKHKGIAYKHPKGWHIPLSENRNSLHLGRDRVLLVGDSAGMADPLLGEGIYYSLWAGKLLSEAILKNPSEPLQVYEKLLKPLRDDILYAGKIGRLAYSFQRVSYKMGHGRALKEFYSVLTGHKSYKEVYRLGWFDFLKHLTKEGFFRIFKV